MEATVTTTIVPLFDCLHCVRVYAVKFLNPFWRLWKSAVAICCSKGTDQQVAADKDEETFHCGQVTCTRLATGSNWLSSLIENLHRKIH